MIDPRLPVQTARSTEAHQLLEASAAQNIEATAPQPNLQAVARILASAALRAANARGQEASL